MTLETLLQQIPQIAVLCVLVALSGLVSASETALFTLTRQQLNRFRGLHTTASRFVLRLRENPGELLSTVLLANIAINILLYSMLGILVARLAQGSACWTALLGAAGFMFILFGAEIGPKLVAFSMAERFAPFAGLGLRVLEIVTAPIRVVLAITIVEPLTRVLSPATAPPPAVTPDELQQLIALSRKKGGIDARENVLLHRLMELSDLRVCALMTPRVDVVAFNIDGDPNDLHQLIRRHRFLRIPTYEGSIDNIRGVIPAKEFLLHPDKPLAEMVQPIQFIPEQARVEALLRHFRKTRSQLALVVDEYGGLAGIVALEDVVESIVGELRAPEEHSTPPPLRRLDAVTYVADGGLDVNDFRRAFELSSVETRVNTVAGMIADRLDHLPEPGEAVRVEHAELTVLGMRGRRVLRVHVKLDRPVGDNPTLAILLHLSHAAQSRPPESGATGEPEGGAGSC